MQINDLDLSLLDDMLIYSEEILEIEQLRYNNL